MDLGYGRIVRLHDLIIALSGGEKGIYDEEAIIDVLEKLERYRGDDVFRKAAVLLEGIVDAHGFMNGNKRLGFILVVLYLQEGGYRLVAGKDEVDDFMGAIARRMVDVPKIRNWLEEHSKETEGKLSDKEMVARNMPILIELKKSDIIEELGGWKRLE